MARADWLTERVREFTALRGRTVHTWTGTEMAFFEDRERPLPELPVGVVDRPVAQLSGPHPAPGGSLPG